MSNVQRIKIPRMPDRSVVECFKELGEKYSVSNIAVSALAFSNIGEVDLSNEENAEFNALLDHDSVLIESCSLRIAGLSISYHRGGQYPPEEKSPIFDEILLNWNPQQGNLSNTDKLDIVAFINSELKAFEPGRFVDTGLSEEQSQLLSIHEGTLERLERLNEDLVRQGSQFRENLEARYDEKTSELEQLSKEKQEKLDKEQEKRNEALEKTQQALADKLSAIDDRDNTHVRREIRDKMLEDVKIRIDAFGVSASTEGKRKPVFFGIIFMAFAIIAMLAYSIFEIGTLAGLGAKENASGVPNLYWLWLKVTFLSVSLLGTILYYVKWQNRWAEQHANSEFQLQQFYIDVNRASWVIESCLEWRKETDSAIPTALLESITRNLFESGNEDLEKVIHPSDELASALLGSASKLKMKVGDSDLEFDKPGKIKAKQASKS